MNNEIKNTVSKYPDAVQKLYAQLEEILLGCADGIEEKLWAKLPSYYVGENFIRLIPFQNHINIQAAAIPHCKELFCSYKITPKGMLQIFTDQDIPANPLKKVFAQTLCACFCEDETIL